MSDNFAKLNMQVQQFCSQPSSLISDESRRLFIELLKAFYYEEDFLKRNKVEQLLGMMRRSSNMDISDYAHIIHSIAFEEYEIGDADFAEHLFRFACDLTDNNSLNNNLAYVLRRRNKDSINCCEIITLLLPGVEERDPFCIINMGLLLALNLSTLDDWKTADDLFALLPNKLNGADLWWEKLGTKNDFEGYLVQFFLLRHKKIEYSVLGSIKSIVWRLARFDNEIPEWLLEEYTIKTLYDVMECVDDDDFNSMLDDFIEHMSCTRERVDEILHVITDWNIWELYNKLLTDCVSLLTPEELAKLKSDYKKKFITYPGEID